MWPAGSSVGSPSPLPALTVPRMLLLGALSPPWLIPHTLFLNPPICVCSRTPVSEPAASLHLGPAPGGPGEALPRAASGPFCLFVHTCRCRGGLTAAPEGPRCTAGLGPGQPQASSAAPRTVALTPHSPPGSTCGRPASLLPHCPAVLAPSSAGWVVWLGHSPWLPLWAWASLREGVGEQALPSDARAAFVDV